MFVIYCGFITGYASYGGGRHLYYLLQHPDQARDVVKLNWIGQPAAIMSLGLGKISVGFLMLRLIGPFVRARRVFLWALIILTFIFSVVCCTLTFVQCSPVEALWETVPGAVCWEPKVQDNFSIFLGCELTEGSSYPRAWLILAGWNSAVDFSLAVLPVSIIWHINISRQKKVGLCTLLGLGLM